MKKLLKQSVIVILLLSTGFLLGFVVKTNTSKESAIKTSDKVPAMNLYSFDSLVTVDLTMKAINGHGYPDLSIYEYTTNFKSHTVRHIKSVAGAVVLIGANDRNCIILRKKTAYDIHGDSNNFSDRFSTNSHKLDSLKSEGYYFYYRIKAVTFDENTSIVDQYFN